MAPIKVPKKPLKSMEKPVEKLISKSKKMKKRNFHNFSIYIYKLLRTLTKNNLGISRKSMLIMNSFVHDMFEKIASEAGRLVAYDKKTTMGSREVHSAIKLLMPQELAHHANMEGLKALSMYQKHKAQDLKE